MKNWPNKSNSDNNVLSAIENSQFFKSEKSEPIWELGKHAPELFQALKAKIPGIELVIESMSTALPIQKNWEFGHFGAYVRPVRHNRAIYLDLSKVPGMDKNAGFIAIKGSEPCSDNFPQIIQKLSEQWLLCTTTMGSAAATGFLDGSFLSSLERFPVLEGKSPAIHAIWDCIEEADCAVELQKIYFQNFNELAKIPTPLLVLKWNEEIRKKALDAIQSYTSKKTAKIVEAEMSSGIGTYIYYYPTLPTRCDHLDLPHTGEVTYAKRMELLRKIADPEKAINGWLDLTARLLALGYVATDPTNLSRGYCLQGQNLVIDGGFVDVNSLRNMDTFKNDSQLRFAIVRTIQVLAQAISGFLAGGRNSYSQTFIQWTPSIYAIVRTGIYDRVKKYPVSRKGLNPILLKELEIKDAFAGIDESLNDLFELHPKRLT